MAYTMGNLAAEFSRQDFRVVLTAEGNHRIETGSQACFDETDAPCLPYISKNYIIPKGVTFKGIIPSFSNLFEIRDVRLESNRLPVPTDGSASTSNTLSPIRYKRGLTYPQEVCRFAGISECENFQVLHLQICPFLYDTEKDQLTFIGMVKYDIEFDGTPNIPQMKISSIERRLLSGRIENPQLLRRFQEMPNDNLKDPLTRLDYVIITSESLREAFEPLIDWKRSKGLFSKIITLEQINQNYDGSDGQIKIKECLRYLYENFGLKYVLLGGDNSIVPVKGCYGYAIAKGREIYEDNNIPTDLFYACLNGTFNWDANGNGICGEIEDNVDMMPQYYVSRVPIQTEEEAKNYISKLISYEQKPNITKGMLMGGSVISGYMDNDNEQSDAEAQARIILGECISPYWDGPVHLFYDTYTDFPSGRDYDFSPLHLEEQIRKGYSLIDVHTHGVGIGWKMEVDGLYTRSQATKQINSCHTFITTTACNTNYFDGGPGEDPCLSEAFIRNPNNGVIGYLGSSRVGWSLKKDNLGASIKYNSEFYKNLFGNSEIEKTWGAIVAAAKFALVSDCQKLGTERWVQFALNPVGDPETFIYTDMPALIDGFRFIMKDSSMDIHSNIDSCRICVKSLPDSPNQFQWVWYDTRNVRDVIPIGHFSVCLTKPGFMPVQTSVLTLQNKTLSNYNAPPADYVQMGERISSEDISGKVIFESGINTITGKEVVLKAGTEFRKGAHVLITSE